MDKVDHGLIVRCHEVAAYTELAADKDLVDLLAGIAKGLQLYAFKSRPKGAKQILTKVMRKRREGRRLLASLKPEREGLAAITSPSEAVKARLTQLDREIERGEKLRDYRPDHVTDAWGCRFVTLYQNDIPTAVGSLLAELHAFNEANHNRARVGLKEFVIYTNRPAHDPLSIVTPTLESLERSQFPRELSRILEPENRKSAYSSVHLVFFRNVEIEHPGKQRGYETAAFEVQVRDIFEEGWGEIQHHLLYSDKDDFSQEDDPTDQELDDGGDEETAWRFHLNALKTFVDGCSQHASIIRRQYDELRPAPSSTNVTQSVTDRVKDSAMVIQALRVRQAPERAIKAVFDGYTVLDSGEQAMAAEERIRWFLQGSRAFSDALELLGDEFVNTNLESGRPVRYYLTIEFGNCHMSAGEENLRLDTPDPDAENTRFEAALGAYKAIVEGFPEDALGHYRLGKCTERLARGAAQLQDALEITKRGFDLVAADALTGLDHWMAIRLRIDEGFILWRLAQLETSEDCPAALDLIQAAAEANLKALEVWKAQSESARLLYDNRLSAHKAASNLLFFGGKLIEAGRATDMVDPDTLKAQMSFIEGLAIETHADYFKTRDNFLHAFRALNDTEGAREMADVNFVELRQLAERRSKRRLVDMASIEAQLRGSEARCFRTAKRFLFPESG